MAMDVFSQYLGWGRVPTLLLLHRYMRINPSRNGVKETEVKWGRLRMFDFENLQLLLGVERLVGVLSRFPHASQREDQEPSDPRTVPIYSSEDLRQDEQGKVSEWGAGISPFSSAR